MTIGTLLRDIRMWVLVFAVAGFAYFAIWGPLVEPVMNFFLVAGTPEDPSWTRGPSLPAADGACPNGGTRVAALLTGQEFCP